MRKKFALLSLLSIGLVACQSPQISSSSLSESSSPKDSSSNPSSPEDSSPTSSSVISTPEPEPLTAEDVLNKLKDENGVGFTGSLAITYLEDGEETDNSTSVLSGFLAKDEYFNEEEGYNPLHFFEGTGENAGLAVRRVLNYDNTVTEVLLADDSGNPVSFDDYRNPFNLLDVSDVKESEEGFTITVPEEAQAAMGLGLLGYSDLIIQTFDIVVEDDAIASISAKADFEYTSAYGVMNVVLDYSFTLVSREEAGVPAKPEPRPSKDGDAELQAAFDELAKGNYSFSYVDEDPTDPASTVKYDVSVDANSIRVDAIASETDEDGSSYGFFQTEDGIVEVDYNDDGTMTALGAADPTATIADYLAPFDIAPELFDVNGSTYTLPDGLGVENNLSHFAIDRMLGDSTSYMLPETFAFTIDGDGTYTVKYTYDLYGFLTGDVSIDIHDVGTTDNGMTEDKLIPYSAPASWDELGVANALASYVGSAENLPFPSTIDGLSITEEGVGLGGYFGAYLSIDVGSPFESGEDGMNAYIAALEKIGWTSAGTNDYGEAVYHLDGETRTYEIGLTPSSHGNSFLIYLYDPITKPIDSPLRTFLEENLVTNATLTTTETGDLYAYDMETGEMGTEVVYEYSSESQNIVTDEGMLYTNTMGGVTAGTYVENTDTGISIYQNAGTGWAHEKDEQGYTAAEYFYTPLDLATLAADLIWDETADTYTLPEDDYSLLFQVLINNGDVPASAVSNLVITFDEEKGEVTYEADILSLFQLTEDSYAAGYIHTEAVLSDIGTSVLTSPITAE